MVFRADPFLLILYFFYVILFFLYNVSLFYLKRVANIAVCKRLVLK